jgi:exoribonuclease R
MSAPPAVPPGLTRRTAPAEADAPGASRRRSDGGAGASRGGRSGGQRGRRASAEPTPPASGAPYAPHLEPAAAAAAVAAGGLFRAVLRCNPGDRAQAFCTVAGLPADVFVRGEGAQNRAVEGDVVALRLLPPAGWHQPAAKRGGGGGSARSTPAPEPPPGPVAPGAGHVKPFRRRSAAAEAAAPAEDDLLAAPALQASASGGDLGVDFRGGGGREGEDTELAAALGSVGLAGVEDAGGAARDGDGDDDGAPHSMAAFLAASFAAAAAGGSPAAAAAPAEEEKDEGDAAARPWERAGGPEAAAAHVDALLGGAYAGWRATGEVVAILSPSPRRAAVVGVLTARGHGLLLTPTNPRLPALKIKPAGLAALTAAERGALAAEAAAPAPPPDGRTLVRAALHGWDAAAARPHGAVEALLGRAGALDAAVRALLDAEGVVDDDAFTPEILACLPPARPWAASPADRAGRRDLRALRAFSIDPPTARDLDDALSVERLGGGALRVGVHIADVAHFVRPGTALDAEAAARATSTYLVDRVVPMLPRPLCEDACSLNPGAERLAFSVVWVMGEEDAVIRCARRALAPVLVPVLAPLHIVHLLFRVRAARLSPPPPSKSYNPQGDLGRADAHQLVRQALLPPGPGDAR